MIEITFNHRNINVAVLFKICIGLYDPKIHKINIGCFMIKVLCFCLLHLLW